MLFSVHAAKVPPNTPTCTQATSEQVLYQHVGWTSRTQLSPAQPSLHRLLACASFVLLVCLSSFFLTSPFSPSSTTFNFASSQSILSFLPLSPMCQTGQGRPPIPLSLQAKTAGTLSCCPFWSTIFHMIELQMSVNGGKAVSVFQRPSAASSADTDIFLECQEVESRLEVFCTLILLSLFPSLL